MASLCADVVGALCPIRKRGISLKRSCPDDSALTAFALHSKRQKSGIGVLAFDLLCDTVRCDGCCFRVNTSPGGKQLPKDVNICAFIGAGLSLLLKICDS